MTRLSRDARAIIDAADGADLPSDERRAQMRRALAARAGLAAGGAIGASLATKAKLASGVASAGASKLAATGSFVVATKIVGGIALVTGAAVAVASVTADPPPPAVEALPTTRAPKIEAAPTMSVHATRTEAPRAEAPVEAPKAEAPAETARTEAPRRAPVPVASPPADPVPAAIAPDTPAAPDEPRPAVEPTPAPVAKSTIAEETALLRRAHAELASSPSRALALLDEHARTYPHGLLAEERDAERVSALCALGDGVGARAATTRFVATYPRSPLAGRVRRTCAER